MKKLIVLLLTIMLVAPATLMAATTADLEKMIQEKPRLKGIEFILGTTKPVAEIAEKTKIFTKIFTGEEDQNVVEAYLRQEELKVDSAVPPDTLMERVNFKKPLALTLPALCLSQ